MLTQASESKMEDYRNCRHSWLKNWLQIKEKKIYSPADHESEDLSPERVLVGLGILDGLVLDEVEDEEERHEAGRDHHPAPVPDLANPEPDHLEIGFEMHLGGQIKVAS